MDVALIVLVVCSVLAGAFGSFVGMYLSRLALFEYLVSHSNLSEIVYTSTLTGEQVVASEADPTGFGTCICFFDRNSSVCQAAAESRLYEMNLLMARVAAHDNDVRGASYTLWRNKRKYLAS